MRRSHYDLGFKWPLVVYRERIYKQGFILSGRFVGLYFSSIDRDDFTRLRRVLLFTRRSNPEVVESTSKKLNELLDNARFTCFVNCDTLDEALALQCRCQHSHESRLEGSLSASLSVWPWRH